MRQYNTLNAKRILSNKLVITHTNDSHVCKAFSSIYDSVCVCLFVHKIKPKWLTKITKLGTGIDSSLLYLAQ